MKKYYYFYLADSTGLHVVSVDSDCTPNAVKAARELAVPHDKRLSCCVVASEQFSLSGIKDNLLREKKYIDHYGRLPWELH